MQSTSPKDYMTASAVARHLDKAQATILKRVHTGELVPDVNVRGKIILFRSDRLPELQRHFAGKEVLS